MPPSELKLRRLRLAYESAYDAYHSCVTALVEIERRRERPSTQLLLSEAAKLRAFNDARERFREAIMQAYFGPQLHDAPPLPDAD